MRGYKIFLMGLGVFCYGGLGVKVLMQRSLRMSMLCYCQHRVTQRILKPKPRNPKPQTFNSETETENSKPRENRNFSPKWEVESLWRKMQGKPNVEGSASPAKRCEKKRMLLAMTASIMMPVIEYLPTVGTRVSASENRQYTWLSMSAHSSRNGHCCVAASRDFCALGDGDLGD